MKNSNILMIAYTNYSTDPRVIREAEALQRKGYNVDFLVLRRKNDSKKERINGINVIHLNQERYRGDSNLFYALAYLQFFFRVFFLSQYLFLRKNYGIIHINNMPDFLVFAFIIPKLLGAKIILDIHDPMPSTYQTKFGLSKRSLFYKFILFEELLSTKFVNKVITVHDPIKYDVLVKDGIPEGKILVIANFADESKFNLIEDYFHEGKIKIVYHGTIAERFGFEYVICELKRLKNVDYSLTIIGEGDYSEKLNNLITTSEMRDKIKFHNKFYPVDELPNILSEYNLGLVSYTLSEATNYMLPLKFLEYTSLGLPSLCVMNRALSYYFEDEDAFFYDSNVECSLSNIIQKIALNKTILISKRNRIFNIREKFLWKTQAEKYCKLIETLIED